MQKAIEKILGIQKKAWENGHENYGTTIDVQASILHFLQYFKHLNPAQKELLDKLSAKPELKYGKKLCSKAHKMARHFVVTLK